MRMNLLLKGSWKKHKQSWPEDSSREDEMSSKDLASDLCHINGMVLKKNYSENAEVVDLHVFADSSLEATCIVALFGHQQIRDIAYVVGKCTVEPLKQQSTPGLLLQAAVQGTELKQLIVDKHDINIRQTFFGQIRQLFCNGCIELTRNNR